MEIKILKEIMPITEVLALSQNWYDGMIKGCVDIVRNKVALGGDYHIESCELLVKDGSHQNDVWGFNIRFEETPEGLLEFDSMVNIKPALGNRGRNVDNLEVTDKAEGIIRSWVTFT
ncbi:MAG: hypothetical protein RL641_183 [Candidatus Parcubacteria bacterium]|jgi:hypothetical protein